MGGSSYTTGIKKRHKDGEPMTVHPRRRKDDDEVKRNQFTNLFNEHKLSRAMKDTAQVYKVQVAGKWYYAMKQYSTEVGELDRMRSADLARLPVLPDGSKRTKKVDLYAKSKKSSVDDIAWEKQISLVRAK